MHLVICEDEKAVAQAISDKLSNKYQDIIIDEYYSGDDLISVFEAKSGGGSSSISASSRKKKAFWDIIILDVVMPGMDGFEVAKYLRDAGDKSIIIFLTGNEQQVFEAFKVEALRYLIKPVEDEKLFEAMDAALEKLQADTREKDDHILIRHNGALTKIDKADIILAEIYNRIVTIHTIHGDYDYYGRMSDLYEKLNGFFFCPHRSYIINMKYVEGYDSREIRLKGGLTANISKKKYSEFVRAYMKYIGR